MLMDEIFKEETALALSIGKNLTPLNPTQNIFPQPLNMYLSMLKRLIVLRLTLKNEQRQWIQFMNRTVIQKVCGIVKKTGGNPTASSGDAKSAYGIQSPFTERCTILAQIIGAQLKHQ